MPEKIVVASDGGAASRAAMDWVANRALHTPAAVEVVTVEELDRRPIGADESKYRRKYVEVLASAEKYLAGRHGITFLSTTLLAGEPADEIVHAAGHVDWLVVGSSRRSADTPDLHGTLALRIAARTASRLTVVPTDWTPALGSVIVGIDEDGSSDEALDVAIAEASRMARDLVLVHAWSLPAPFSVLEGLLKTSYPTLEALHRRRLKKAATRVKLIAPRLKATSILNFGSPAAVLAEVARDQALLVLGRHHRSRLEHLFLGSVGHAVLLAAPAPVMIVPGQK